MSKRRRNSRQTIPNYTRSKTGPAGRRNCPKTDWSAYNKDYHSEEQRLVRWMRHIAKIARGILYVALGARDWRASAILVYIIKGPDLLGPDQAL